MSALNNVIQFALEASESLSVSRRAALFRDLADICGDEQEEANLRELANQLSQLDGLCRHYNISFSQRVTSPAQRKSGGRS